MTRLFSTAAFVLLLSLGFARPNVHAQTAPPQTAEDILSLVRYSQALQDHDLTGQIRDGATGQKVPFVLTMQNSIIRFRFPNEKLIIHMELTPQGPILKEVKPGSTNLVPMQQHSQPVLNTSLNYEDLSMRYLYWPNPQLIGEERINTRKCWRIRVYAPDKLGPYHAVEVWVDQASGGMILMQGYDFAGKIIKRSEVKSGQKVDGIWILKEMRVETYAPTDPNSPTSRSYLEITGSKKNAGQ